ncbi:hypothetical protein [Moorena producens]|uniref:hypothetical protein n=1 Tax=Moorena producens TaxID=1155739 RepID=UPI000A9D5A08|nr:hypothetical protein [Moorena producens]
MQSASGGNHGSRSWGEPPRPRCLPKTALHRLIKISPSPHHPITPSPHLPISPHFYYGYSTELDIILPSAHQPTVLMSII